MTIKIHPIYDSYEFDSETGRFRKIQAGEWLDGVTTRAGYRSCNIRSIATPKQKTMSLHRAVWEAFNGAIAEGYEIDHIDKNKTNNALSNLRCVTVSENRKVRNHDFLKEVRKLSKEPKKIRSIEIATGDTKVFKTKTACGKYFGCSPALIYLICEGKNRAKTFASRWKFEYTDDDVDTTVVPVRKIRKDKGIKRNKEEKKEDA